METCGAQLRMSNLMLRFPGANLPHWPQQITLSLMGGRHKVSGHFFPQNLNIKLDILSCAPQVSIILDTIPIGITMILVT